MLHQKKNLINVKKNLVKKIDEINKLEKSPEREKLENEVIEAKNVKEGLEGDIEKVGAEITMAREVEEEQKSKELSIDNQVKQ